MPVSTIHKLLFTVFLSIVLANKMDAQQDSLVINEVCVGNIDQFIDPSYNYGGWIELYNPSSTPIALNGMVVRHTNADGETEQSFLKQTHRDVPAKGYAVLWFDHNSKDGYYGRYAGSQIPFKLDADGGIIELLDTTGITADAIEYPASISRCSWIRQESSDHVTKSFGWTNTPTPNASNDTVLIAEERLLSPIISITGGTFANSYHFTVDIPEGCTLYYTTDGSAPIHGTSLVSPDGIFDGNEDAIYRFMLTRDGYLNSPIITHSFIKTEGKFSLPILSVNTAPDNFFDDTIGLYVTGTNGRIANNSKVKANQNMDWERPVNMEYFVPDTNMKYAEALNQEATFSLFGGWTRFNRGNADFQYRPSFKIKSDKVFDGMSSFAYPIFDSKPYVKIKNFLVRNGGQDGDARIWDGAIQELLRTSGVYLDCQAWQPAHVFLNGRHLGMMNLREESNKQFAFSNYGIGKDEIDAWEGDIIIKEGDKAKLDEWYDLSTKLTGTSQDSILWKEISDIVDIDEYCNYMAAETYIGNLDWLRGGFKNLKGFRAKDDKGKFHIVLHDVDGGFGATDMILQVLKKGTGSLPIRFKNMLKYEPFKKQFIDAYCIMDGSVFDPARCEPIITDMKNTVNRALNLEGLTADIKADTLIARLKDNQVRRPALRQSLMKAFDLKDDYNISLQSNIPDAKLEVNGQDIPTGKFNGYLFPPIKLTSAAPDGYTFKEWLIDGESLPTDSILLFSEAYPCGTYDIMAIYEKEESSVIPIRINEVSAGNDIFINEYGNKADWIELYNNTDKDYDLTGAYLSDNPENTNKFQIQATNCVNTVISAHGYKIVWCDGKDSKTQIHTSFKLKNADNAFVSFTAANNVWTDSLRYKEQPRWSTYGRFPDGGHHLALFERPTIDNANRRCTSTIIENSAGIPNDIAQPVYGGTSIEITAIRYFNLNGQQISNIQSGQIVIQQLVYSDGHITSRKIVVKN